MRPELSPIDVARLTLMILAQCDDERVFSDDKGLSAALHDASFRLEAASDQHAAVATELERLSADGPVDCTEEQLRVLLRAVKVQSQVLEIYTEQPSLV